MDTARTFAGRAGAQGEGDVTTMIESQTAKIPSGTYLSVAIVAMVGSAALMLFGQRNLANFVGQWAPTILIIGLQQAREARRQRVGEGVPDQPHRGRAAYRTRASSTISLIMSGYVRPEARAPRMNSAPECRYGLGLASIR